MGIALEAMMGIVTLALIYVAPPLHVWIRQHLSRNQVAANLLRLLFALCMVLPAGGFALGQFQSRTAGVPSETVTGIVIGMVFAWIALSLVIPLRLLASGQWDLKTKELFRLFIGLFMFSYLVLLLWWGSEVSKSSGMFAGHLRWAFPVGVVILGGVEYLILKVGWRVLPSGDAETS